MAQATDFRAVGCRIAELRGNRTQKEFAKLIGSTQSTVSLVECGYKPPLEMLLTLRALSGKSIDWILFGEG